MAKVSVLTEKQIELLHRINTLKYETIKGMSPDGLSRLTSEFHEPLVNALICKVTTNELQRELFRFIKNSYEQWMMLYYPFWKTIIGNSNKYPDYMNDMQLDIECGMVISKKGSYFPPITVQDNGEQKDSTTNASSESKIKELEEELESYKEKKKGIDQHLTAVLGLKFVEILGINYDNKKQLAPVLSQLFGWGKRKLEQELCTVIREEDELKLANIFGELSPELAKKIYPKWEGKSSENIKSQE